MSERRKEREGQRGLRHTKGAQALAKVNEARPRAAPELMLDAGELHSGESAAGKNVNKNSSCSGCANLMKACYSHQDKNRTSDVSPVHWKH